MSFQRERGCWEDRSVLAFSGRAQGQGGDPEIDSVNYPSNGSLNFCTWAPGSLWGPRGCLPWLEAAAVGRVGPHHAWPGVQMWLNECVGLSPVVTGCSLPWGSLLSLEGRPGTTAAGFSLPVDLSRPPPATGGRFLALCLGRSGSIFVVKNNCVYRGLRDFVERYITSLSGRGRGSPSLVLAAGLQCVLRFPSVPSWRGCIPPALEPGALDQPLLAAWPAQRWTGPCLPADTLCNMSSLLGDYINRHPQAKKKKERKRKSRFQAARVCCCHPSNSSCHAFTLGSSFTGCQECAPVRPSCPSKLEVTRIS